MAISKIINLVFLIGLSLSFQTCYSFWGLAPASFRTYSQEHENPKYTASRSFLKAKQWFNYRLEGNKAKITYEDQENGIVRGTGFFQCRVPYGVGEVDVEFHEFGYNFQLQDKKARVEFFNIYSYSRDPNDITISYGPRNEREARITIRKCFEPLAEDLFGYIQ